MSSSTTTLGFLLHDVARLMRKRFEQRAGRLGFTRSQWQVLVHLAKNEGIHQAGLAEILEVEPIGLTRILDRLVARGLVERRQHPKDRRVWLLHLTPEAHPSIALLRRIGEETRADAMGALPDTDLDVLMATLTGLKCNLIAACASGQDAVEVHHG